MICRLNQNDSSEMIYQVFVIIRKKKKKKMTALISINHIISE